MFRSGAAKLMQHGLTSVEGQTRGGEIRKGVRKEVWKGSKAVSY